ncbi:hypothetical protein N7495_008649 [Penicillium taxi]|uniref:uncharacterized protein n=1 Tax=Penicillium taxi TaxID=168475 RepID=UPI002544F4DE|nr:uncharacterized protein N7495_008649 [Penicillium taxi]KAJ5888608.1 hypothetical protein N7495_008649 [Penicillium taxi]
MSQYINQLRNRRRSSQITRSYDPVLTDEDAVYLQHLTDQSSENDVVKTPVEHSKSVVLDEGAQDIPLPASPAEDFGKTLGEAGRRAGHKGDSAGSTLEASKSPTFSAPEKKKRWSIFGRKNSVIKGKDSSADKSKKRSPTLATTETPVSNEQEDKKDLEDITDVLERLNLAADNNRVFSISAETQELLRKFKLIFKDLINGVPTAYHDLEMLLTNGNRQLQDTYTKLPSFLQNLIEKLPAKWTETLAPEMLAVAASKASSSGVNMEHVGKAASAAEKIGMPSLKELVSKPAAMVGMLRSIMAFLRARFPAVMGLNILWSLALFILLFVLWYCHKRGREVRLENERIVTEEEIQKLNAETSEGKIRPTETLVTTAPQGASTDEIREGVKKVEQARASSGTEIDVSEPAQSPNQENVRPGIPTRSKSRLAYWTRSKNEPIPESISPYPGT